MTLMLILFLIKKFGLRKRIADSPMVPSTSPSPA